jgi:hypothetical protein
MRDSPSATYVRLLNTIPVDGEWTILRTGARNLNRNVRIVSLSSPKGGEGRGEEELSRKSNCMISHELNKPLTPTLSPLSRGEREI